MKSEFSISFEDIFKAAARGLDHESVDRFLRRVVKESLGKKSNAPDELIRVVDGMRLHWMTAAQAEDFLETEREGGGSLKSAVEFALHGDSRILALEMRLLMLMAGGSLERYRESNGVPRGEIDRVGAQLDKLGKRVHACLSDLRDIERRAKRTRGENPVLGEFESKMARFLTCQKNGDKDEALELARDLARIKSRYVLAGKALANDRNKALIFRMNIQRHKRSVLSCHQYLAAQREGALEDELVELRKSRDLAAAAAVRETGGNPAAHEEKRREKEARIADCENELRLVRGERAMLKLREDETAAVIERIVQHLNGEARKEAPGPKKRQDEDAAPDPSPPKASAQRMARSRRREPGA